MPTAVLSPLKFCHDAIPKTLARRLITEIIESGQHSPDRYVREFEAEWANFHNTRHAIFVNSGTDALRLSLLAMKEKFHWHDGDNIAVPALTFVATVNVILQANLKPFFVDVNHLDYTLNIYNLRQRISDSQTKIRAILPVHLFGMEVDPKIYEQPLPVLTDSCEAVGIQSKGTVTAFSTYMAHHVTTGVGGFATTNDNELNLLIRSYANHGRNVNYLPGYGSIKMGKELLKSRFQFDRMGYSCRGTEMQAALGLAQMDTIDEQLSRRHYTAERLTDALDDIGWLQLPREQPGRKHAWMMYPVVIRDDVGIDKYEVCLNLEAEGIETRDMMPITSQPCFRDLIKDKDTYSVANWINEKGFYLPCHPGVTDENIARIRAVLTKF